VGPDSCGSPEDTGRDNAAGLRPAIRRAPRLGGRLLILGELP
jgi:hypothetical protein